MQNSFFQAICRMGIFMICAQAIVHFRPQEAYEKYLKLLVSVMVLVQLFLPVGSFLLGRGGQEAAELLRQFGIDLEESMKTATENAAATDALLERMTLEEIMRQMETEQDTGVLIQEGVAEWPDQEGQSGQTRQGSQTGQSEQTRQGSQDTRTDQKYQGTQAGRENQSGQTGDSRIGEINVETIDPVTINVTIQP